MYFTCMTLTCLLDGYPACGTLYGWGMGMPYAACKRLAELRLEMLQLSVECCEAVRDLF